MSQNFDIAAISALNKNRWNWFWCKKGNCHIYIYIYILAKYENLTLSLPR